MFFFLKDFFNFNVNVHEHTFNIGHISVNAGTEIFLQNNCAIHDLILLIKQSYSPIGSPQMFKMRPNIKASFQDQLHSFIQRELTILHPCFCKISLLSLFGNLVQLF